MCKVSILVPIYKCENFVYKCADSLFSQTFEDVEFIFYDDCSPDRSVQVIESCSKKYPNRKDQVRIISGKYNVGVAAARNLLLAEANGEYIWYIDSDDWIEPNSITLLYHTAIASNADVVSFGFYCENKKRTTMRLFSYSSLEECLKDVISSNWGVVWRFFFRRTVATENNIMFSASYKGGEDYVFCAKFLLSSCAVSCVIKPLYHYVTYNTESLMSTKDFDSLRHQYEATLDVERILLKKNILKLYASDLNQRKLFIVKSFDCYFSSIWGRLYLASLRRFYNRCEQKVKTAFNYFLKLV
ncbi:glycosyltransferase family 2 protein [Phocaeicola sartorii]|uniref:glycosyltransferase family 2 protein n=1 Tax=Phocaeicola sartorii TaxID=671267 RepID=UPI00266F97AA|nr:glycosyltransferase family 2 protein [Phocaeicola sartorii]